MFLTNFLGLGNEAYALPLPSGAPKIHRRYRLRRRKLGTKPVEHVVHLRLLPSFLSDSNPGAKEVGNIVKALKQYPLPSEGVDVLPLLRFLWTETGLRIVQKRRKFWNTIELTEVLSRHEYLKNLCCKKLISTVKMLNTLDKTHLMIGLAIAYNRKCSHYACKDMSGIFWNLAKGDSFNKVGLVVSCEGGGVEGTLDEVSRIGTNRRGSCRECRKIY